MQVTVITKPRELTELVKRLQTAKYIGYDLEFSPLNPKDNSRLFIMSLCIGDTAYVLDFTQLKLADAKPIFPFLESKKIVKIGHNLSIDWKHTFHHFGVAMQNCYCTMVAEEVITAGLDVEKISIEGADGKKSTSSFSLAALMWRRFGYTMEKESRKYFIHYDGNPFTREAYAYAGGDTLYLEQIYKQQQKEIAAKGLERTIALEMRLLPEVALMEYHGIPFDIEKCQEAVPVVDKVVARMEHWLQDMFIKAGVAETVLFTKEGYTAVNTGSHKQLLDAFHKMDITVEGTDKNVLKEWDFANGMEWNDRNRQAHIWDESEDETGEFDVAYVNAVLRHHAVKAALMKFRNTYLIGLQDKYHAPTDKIYPSFRQCGARATGRFSSNNPNFQNMIRSDSLKALGLKEYDVRSMFHAEEGTKLCIVDFEGIELVLLAIISKDEALQNVIIGGDAHSPVASIISKTFGLPPVTNENKGKEPFKAIRNVAKTLTYAKMYGSGAKNLYKRLSIPLAIAGCKMTYSHAADWMQQWDAMFPKAAVALEDAAQKAASQLYVETVLGRRRQWDESILLDNSKKFGAMRQGANSLVQGSAADLMKVAFVRVADRLDRKRSKILAQIHDELLVQLDDDYAEEGAKIIGEQMVLAGELLFKGIPHGLIKAIPKISNCYDK